MAFPRLGRRAGARPAERWPGCRTGGLLATGLAVLLWALPAAAQQPAAAAPAPAGERLRVFLDCPVPGCDRDFFTTELPFVVWVRDLGDADVRVLIAALGTGAGGTAYTLTFHGGRAWVGQQDTLIRAVPPTASDDDRRRALAHALTLGLTRYALRGPLAERFRVVFDSSNSPRRRPAAGPAPDRWNAWVFEVDGAASLAAEQRTRTITLSGELAARRVTERFKTTFAVVGGYSESHFELSDGTPLTFQQQVYGFNSRFVRALTDHWSTGLSAAVSRNDYQNQQMTLQGAPAIEYNLFPWRDATLRQLTVSYLAGAEYSRYEAETIYLKTREALPFQQLMVGAAARQPWGSVDATLSARQSLQDLARYNLNGALRMSLRVAGGLALSVDLSAARIRDQPYLARGTLSDEEILTHQRELATSYRVQSTVGLTYTFGSIYTAVVNPRLNAF